MIAIIPSQGMGDGLLMQIFAYQLQKAGHPVVTFHNHLPSFGRWFSSFTTKKINADLSPILLRDQLASFSTVILQHDNQPRSEIIRHFKETKVYTFFGSFQEEKHGKYNADRDFIADRSKPMVENIEAMLQTFFQLNGKENGLTPPKNLTYRKYPKRIAIHSVTKDPSRTWKRRSFEKVFILLQSQGLDPVFITDLENAEAWGAPRFETLEELTSFLYESGGLIGNDSGPAHLASCLNLPNLVIGPNPHHLAHWRPDWRKGAMLTLPHFLYKQRFLRPFWSSYIRPSKVAKSFLQEYSR